jgi:hypothetical protein
MILEILVTSALVALCLFSCFSGSPMAVALRAAVRCLLVVPCAGCSPTPADCSDVIPGNEPAIFNLSCGPTDLTSVALSGPCSTGDASPSNYLFGAVSKSLAFDSPSPGRCHVFLTFATGFTYSTDVTFTSQTDTVPPGCHVSSYTAPTQQTFTVNNPGGTCVVHNADAGVDASKP